MKKNRMRFRFLQIFYDILYIWNREIKMSFKDQGMLIFFILVPLAYPLIYAFIYNNETVHDVPAVVVDQSRTSLSRTFIRRVDATPDVRIVAHANDMEEAKSIMRDGEVYGIIYVPESFSKDLNQGKQTQVSLFCDMSGMLYYKALLTASTNVSLDMNKHIKIERAGNTTNRQDELTAAPMEYEDISIFNPQNGFAAFLLPAVLILLIQQTLLLGVGLSAGTSRETSRFKDLIPISQHYHGTFRILIGKSVAYLMIYLIMTIYLLIVVPKMFGFVQLASFSTILWFVLPYLLSCIMFAMACSIFIHHRESCMMIYVFTSVPLLFISGISWPGSAIPPFWKALSYLFPSTLGINGFVRLNTMGASLADVKFEWIALWIQTIIYFCITYIVYRMQVVLSRKHAYQQLIHTRKRFHIVSLFFAILILSSISDVVASVPSPVVMQNIKVNVRIVVKNSANEVQEGVILRVSGRTEEFISNSEGVISFPYEYDKSMTEMAYLYFPSDKFNAVKSFPMEEKNFNTTLYVDSPMDIAAYRQSNKGFPIIGVVKTSNGVPIENASVSIQGTGKSTKTNSKGEFNIEADFNHPIVFRADGMENQKYNIDFFLMAPTEAKTIYMYAKNAGNVYTSAQKMPEFKGGMKAYFEYIDVRMKYPAAARAARQEGVVVVQFIVETDGSITEPTIVRKSFPELDAEALRLITAMPKWEPAKENGMAVRCKYSVPVNFTLNKRSTKQLKK